MEELANHHGLEPYAVDGNIGGVASARGSVGQLLSSEISISVCRSCSDKEKATPSPPFLARWLSDTAESENLGMRGHSKRENREILSVSSRPRWPLTAVKNDQRTSPRVRLI
jgi:hypothetical protein